MESSTVAEGDEEVPELCFKERAEKSTGGEVVLLEWSPTMDILALAFSDHSVSYHWKSECSITHGAFHGVHNRTYPSKVT